MPVFPLRRRVHDARDVARFRKHEGLVVRAHPPDAVERAAPLGDVVGLAGHGHQGVAHLGEREAALLEEVEAPLGQPVAHAELAQVLRHHRSGQVRAVAVPVQEVEGRRRLAQHVGADRGPVDEVVRPQVGERPPHEELVEVALRRGLALDAGHEVVVEEHAHLARVGEVGHRGEEGGGGDARVLPPRHERQRRGERGAGDAVADRVHLVLARGGLRRLHRAQEPVLDVVAQRHVPERRVGVGPGHHEERVALLHDPAHEAVLRLEVEDVELVDPGREEHERPGVHPLRRRRVLDQLEHPLAQHDLAGRGRDVLAQGEGVRVRKRHQPVAAVALDVPHEVLEPLDQALAFGLHRPAHRLGVGGEEVRGREEVEDLLREEGHASPVGRGQSVEVAHGVADRPGADLVLLAQVGVPWVLAPERVAEPLVAGKLVGGRAAAVQHRLLGRDGVLQGLAPVAHLTLDQLGGIGGHLGPVGRHRLRVELRSRTLEARIRRLPPAERGDEALGQRVHPQEVLAQSVERRRARRLRGATARRVVVRGVGHSLKSHLHAATANAPSRRGPAPFTLP